MPTYTEAVPRNTWDKHGERVSVLDYGALTTDASTAINSAIEAVAGDRGGASIQIPVGKYVLNTPIIVDKPNIVVYGEGDNSILQRGANMPDNQGLFTITASNVLLRDFQIDGNVTTAAPIDYNSFSMDPMDLALTKNTSIWVKGAGSQIQKVRFERLSITHTGGYAILFDARTQYLVHMRVLDCRFINNRPHLFGFTGDINYGAWTGGVFFKGDGSSNAVHDLLVSGCSFMRCDGNCVWSHVSAFARLHSNIRIKQNDFLDVGLDDILMGGVNGGVVEGNTLRRVGYISKTDSDNPNPKWLSNKWAVGIDTSGITMGVNYTGNTLTSCNGGYIDCDGFSRGVISGNKCRTPGPSDQDYATDQIAAGNWGGRQAAGQSDWAYGVNFGNTSHAQTTGGAMGASVVGNSFENMGGGAIRLYAARSCYVSDNEITMQPSPAGMPIQLGNILYPDPPSNDTRGYNNVVINNRIHWDVPSFYPAVFEDSNAGGYGQPYQAGEGNVVRANDIISATFYVYEFDRDPTSTSNAAHWYASNYGTSGTGGHRLTYTAAHVAQREGYDVDGSSVLRWYVIEAGNKELHMQLQAYRGLNASNQPILDPLLNISKAGGAISGVITTGNRTAIGLSDTVATGKLYADGMLCLANTNYSDTEADALPATIGLMRYVSGTPNVFQVSVSKDASNHRVWTTMGGGGSGGPVAGADKSIIYNAGGASAGDTNLTWDYTNQQMVLLGKPGQAGLQVRGGSYIASDVGFLSYQPSYQAFNGGTYGGGALMAGIGVIPYTPPPNPPNPTDPPNGGYINMAPLGYANYPTPLKNATFASDQVLLWNAGQNGTTAGNTNTTTGLMTNAFINAAAGFVTPSPYYNAIQATGGGIRGVMLSADRYTHIGKLAADPASGTLVQGDGLDPGMMYWNTTSNSLMVYNGTAFVPVTSPQVHPGGQTKSVQYNAGGVFGGDANFLWDLTNQQLGIIGKAGS